MALENKYGKSAVDATRRNALPPYLDELFADGIGGAGVETHDITLTTGGWSNLQQSVVLTCGATDASDVVCAANNTSMDSDYYMSAFGVSLSNVTVVEGEEEGQNTVTFTFTAVTVPTVNIDVVVVIINSDSSGASYLEELVDEANSSKNISVTKAAEAAISATNAQSSAETAAGIETLLQQLLTQYRDSVYPIGSIYYNIDNVNPSTLFGGTWVQLSRANYGAFTFPAGTISAGETKTGTLTLTTNGGPVLLAVSGDFNPLTSATCWITATFLRGSTQLCREVSQSNAANSMNQTFALTYLDIVGAGTYTYSAVLNNSNADAQFGEGGGTNAAPTFFAIELGTNIIGYTWKRTA